MVRYVIVYDNQNFPIGVLVQDQKKILARFEGETFLPERITKTMERFDDNGNTITLEPGELNYLREILHLCSHRFISKEITELEKINQAEDIIGNIFFNEVVLNNLSYVADSHVSYSPSISKVQEKEIISGSVIFKTKFNYKVERKNAGASTSDSSAAAA